MLYGSGEKEWASARVGGGPETPRSEFRLACSGFFTSSFSLSDFLSLTAGFAAGFAAGVAGGVASFSAGFAAGLAAGAGAFSASLAMGLAGGVTAGFASGLTAGFSSGFTGRAGAFTPAGGATAARLETVSQTPLPVGVAAHETQTAAASSVRDLSSWILTPLARESGQRCCRGRCESRNHSTIAGV